jgi:hypothetical protein
MVQGTEVQSLDIIPDPASEMIGWEQLVQRGGTEDDLVAVGGAEPRSTAKDRWVGGWHGPVVISRRLEEQSLFGPGRTAIAWSVHEGSIA